jgi:hypothetical protein
LTSTARPGNNRAAALSTGRIAGDNFIALQRCPIAYFCHLHSGETMNQSFSRRWASWTSLAGSLIAAGLLAGCGESSGTLPVTGKVTKGGQPVAGAAVVFEPSGSSKDAKSASGTTDASGVYKLTTFVNGDGALPGNYKVKITKFPGADVPAMEAPKEASQQDIDAIYKAMQEKGKYGPGAQTDTSAEIKNELDNKYADVNTSGLTAEVKAGATTFDFTVD